MNPFFKQLKSVKMTSDEKSRIRHTLVTLTKANIADYRESDYQAKSPLKGAVKSPFKTPVSGWRLASNFRTVGAAVLILILASTGVSFAAEKTLPGDLLFPVKVNLTEEVRGALTISSEAKMDWEKERVVRRVVETEILLKTNNLTPKRKIQAETAIKTQMQTFANAAAATSEKNPNAVIAATAELEPALKVHQETIADIAATSDANSIATSEILSTVALGITATTEQETVAIASAEVNAPDTFAELTDAKISGAEVAIDVSDMIITKAEDAKTKEVANQSDTTESAAENVATMSLIAPDPTTNTDTKTDSGNDPKADPKTDTKVDTQTTTPPEATLKSEVAADTMVATLKIAAPVLDPKEILANAKAKLAQAKVLRDKGDFKAALTLAQEAYKDMVALKLQAKIANKSKQPQTKENPTTEKTPGEVKGTSVETKTEIKTETKTIVPEITTPVIPSLKQ